MGSTARLIVLGSGTAVPMAGRATSCYLVDDGAGWTCLVDAGPGALHRAAAAGYPLERLDAVLLTHVHPDHCADLVAIQFALRIPGAVARSKPLVIAGDASVALLVARLRNAWPGRLGVDATRLIVQPIGPGPLDLHRADARAAAGAATGATVASEARGPRVEAFAVAHMAGSLGYRLTLPDGFTLAFSGDATEGADLLALGRDADLFVLEAAAPDERPVPGHLTPGRAGAVARDCGAKHLLLTHFYPAVLREPIATRAGVAFEGRVTLAEDGLILPLVR